MEIREFKPRNFEYSHDLVHIPAPPKSLFIRGELPSIRIKSVAIIGARKPTAYGKEIARNLASTLAKNGIVVVSGLALGIDSEAHCASLEAGGTTLAVLAGGLDKIYPSSHKSLAEKIISSGGALISEYPAGSPPQPYRFLERNRLVSGLADAVVIVEAAARSGTLSTANHALDQGKDVFAVPGNITSPLSEGCNQLIKNGAIPLLSPQDLVEFLLPNSTPTQASLLRGDTEAENLILDLLKSGVRNSSDLLAQSALPVADFNQAITMLEIKGLITDLGANEWGLA